MGKLGQAMTSGRTGQAPEPQAAPGAGKADTNGDAHRGTWVQPQRFKSLVGRNHPEFSSARQQVRLGLPRYQPAHLCQHEWDDRPGGRQCPAKAPASCAMPGPHLHNRWSLWQRTAAAPPSCPGWCSPACVGLEMLRRLATPQRPPGPLSLNPAP